jgi:hypothetical protein
MPWVRIEPTIPASQRAKTVHALDLAASVIDMQKVTRFYFQHTSGIHTWVGNSNIVHRHFLPWYSEHKITTHVPRLVHWMGFVIWFGYARPLWIGDSSGTHAYALWIDCSIFSCRSLIKFRVSSVICSSAIIDSDNRVLHFSHHSGRLRKVFFMYCG